MPTNPTATSNPWVGSLLTLKGEFQQKNVDMNPGGVGFMFRKPGSSVPTSYTFGTDPQIYRDSPAPLPGIYYVDLNLDTAGRWYWRWFATGTGQAVSEGYFDVEPSQLG